MVMIYLFKMPDSEGKQELVSYCCGAEMTEGIDLLYDIENYTCDNCGEECTAERYRDYNDKNTE